MIRFALRVVGLAVIVALIVPVLLAQEKGKDKEKDKDKAVETKLDLRKLKMIPGTLVSASSEKGGITISYQVPQLRGGPKSERMDLMPAEDMKVRTTILPPFYDDKGKLRRPTAEELKKAKGDNIPPRTYVADTSSLKPNQKVEVYCTIPKQKPKKKGEEPDEDSKPHVKLIVIVAEAKE
jgi:hypothetical protein